MEIVPKAPGGKLISKSSLGEGRKERGIFFLISLGGRCKKVGQLTFYSIFRGGSMLAAMTVCQFNLSNISFVRNKIITYLLYLVP